MLNHHLTSQSAQGAQLDHPPSTEENIQKKGTREDGAKHQLVGKVLTKYVEPSRWADSPVDQVLRHASVVAHIIRTHLVEEQG